MCRPNTQKIIFSFPRNQRNPIDGYMYDRMYSRHYNASERILEEAQDPMLYKIRKSISIETGTDPYGKCDRRNKELVASRYYFIHFAMRNTKYSQAYVTNLVGKMYSTANYTEKYIKRHYDTELEFRVRYKKIETRILEN
jgi:hypothetical protein